MIEGRLVEHHFLNLCCVDVLFLNVVYVLRHLM